MSHTPIKSILAGLALGSVAFAGGNDKKIETPPSPSPDSWEFKLALPGWIPWMTGDVGLHGVTSHVNLGPDDVIPKIDMVADVRAEAHKDRFSVMGEFLYMSLSDGIGTNSMVQKLDMRVDQTMGDLGFGWRLIESPRGCLDVTAGVRYSNYYQRLILQPNDAVISQTSQRLADAVSGSIRARLDEALSEADFRSQIRAAVVDRVADQLNVLKGKLPSPPTLPSPPLAGRDSGPIGKMIRELIQAKTDQIRNAVRAAAESAADAARAAFADKTAAAQAKAQEAAAALRAAVDQQVQAAKKDLSAKIAHALHEALDTRFSRTDRWWDPYIGLRGRYNLNEKFYLSAKGDVGGFTVGSDFSWTAEVALGWQMARNLYTELGYRAMGVNYRNDGLVMDTITHGPQVTLGFNF